MKQPYNSGRQRIDSGGNRKKLELLMLVIAMAATVISCQNASPAPVDHTAGRPSATVIADADQLYAGRADLIKVRQGIVALRQAQGEDQSNYELAWRLAKFNYYLGAHSPTSSERDKAFQDGVAAGQAAVKLQDGKAEGHFWLGANYGGKAQNSVFFGLSEVEAIKHEMEAVLKIDEGYQSGSAYMVLGQVCLQSPRVLGGDTQKAIEYLEKGLRFGPDNALLRAHLARAYADANRTADARKQIDAIKTMKPAAGFEPEHQEALVEVGKLEEKLK